MSAAGDGDAVLDVLDHPGVTTRRRWLLGIAVAAAVTLGLVGAYVDHRARAHEFDQVLAHCLAGRSDYRYADRQVAAMAQYAAPLLLRPDAPAGTRTDMAATVRAVAATGADSLTPDRDALAAVTILPWHGSLHEARSACQSYLTEADGRLRRAAADLTTLDLPTGYLGVRLDGARTALVAAALDASSVAAATQAFEDAPGR